MPQLTDLQIKRLIPVEAVVVVDVVVVVVVVVVDGMDGMDGMDGIDVDVDVELWVEK